MFLLLILILLATLYFFLKYHYSQWERQNFPQIKPSIPLGNLMDTFTQKRGFGFNIKDLHDSTKEKFIGIYLFFRPAVLVRDPELVKHILKTDFSSFQDRGIFHDATIDPLVANIFTFPGEKWKNMRSKQTPAFTSGKLKEMYPNILTIAEDLQDYLKQYADKDEVLEIKEMMSRYTVNVIASVIFGVEVNTIREADHKFNKIAGQINKPYWMEGIRVMLMFLCPKLVQFFRIKHLEPEVPEFFLDIVKQTIEHREKNNVTRKDLMQLLIQLRNGGTITAKDDDWQVRTEAEKDKFMTFEEIAAEAFMFFSAGVETSAASIAYTLYEVSKNEELQKELQAEIDETLEKHDGVVSYESIKDMKLLQNCMNETVRMYPGLPFLNRECTKDYKIPDSDLVIKKGTSIFISLFGLHRDAEHFPDPMKFDPSRHLDYGKFNQSAYIPFGDGPRACIGIRMGRINVKTALILLLSKYTFTNAGPDELEFENALALMPKGGLNLKISNRKM